MRSILHRSFGRSSLAVGVVLTTSAALAVATLSWPGGSSLAGHLDRTAPLAHAALPVRSPAAPATRAALDVEARPQGPTSLRRTIPAPASCQNLIDIDLTSQRLVASRCGAVFTATPITSGRPGLRTPTGTFSIYLKEQNVYFHSPWPQGDPNYYPPMYVAYAMAFLDGGYFLHTDPDEPPSAFGPGSEDGGYASHGCVHVPQSVMPALYAWASTGTTVRIHY